VSNGPASGGRPGGRLVNGRLVNGGLAGGGLAGGAPAGGAWHRLHPLSPLVRSGRTTLGVLALVGITASGGFGPSGSHLYDGLAAALVAVGAVVSWLVTRWKLEPATLCIETGLLRRDSRQLPVARIQAVDVVRPFLARALGLAELRVRLAGSPHADGRLAYLPEQAALDLRARLLATHHGLDPGTPEPAEAVLTSVPAGRLVGSVAASSGSLVAAVLVAEVVALIAFPALLAPVGGTAALWLLSLAAVVWRRIATDYGFTVAQAPDGLRIRRGLLSTVAETIPRQRVQAVRMVEPLLWRPLGWCRLEIDVAGSPGRDRSDGSGRVRKTLLPVGRRATAGQLMRLVMGAEPPGLEPPPRRAAVKAPLSYHFLVAGHDRATAVGVTGRVRRVTTWLPLEKVQSVRMVSGPVQRRLSLATVCLDAAGRRVSAEFRDRDAAEAGRLVETLATLCRTARRQAAAPAPAEPAPAAVTPPGQSR
jgi:putative membrane protein